MEGKFRARRLAVVVLAVVMLGASAGGAASDGGATAVPNPPGVICDTTHGPYYDHLVVVVLHVPNATSYKVYRALSAGGTKYYVGNASYYDYYRSVYDDYDVDTFQTYYYWAKACNSSGCSAWGSGDGCQLDTYPAPTNVQASDGTYSNYVRVTYNEVSGPSKYAIYRSTTSISGYSFVGYDWDSDYSDTGAEPGVLLYYKVKSCTALGQCGPYSSYNSGHRRIAAPTRIFASDGNWNGYVPVEWPAVAHATYYLLYRGTDSMGYDSSWTKTLSSPEYDDHTVVGTTHYFYWVKACNSLSCSGLRGPDEGWAGEPPPVPTNVQASDGWTFMIRVTWNGSAEAQYYEVWRANALFGTYSKQNTETVTDTQWDDFYTSPGVTYWYKVKACKWLGCSELSAAASGTRAGPPAPPENVSATDGVYLDKVRITWSPSDGALAYQVYRNTVDNSSTATQLTSNAGNTYYNDYPPLAGPANKYYYWVMASNSAGWSGYSASDTGYRAAPTATPTRTPTATPTSTPRPTNTPGPTPTRKPGAQPRIFLPIVMQ